MACLFTNKFNSILCESLPAFLAKKLILRASNARCCCVRDMQIIEQRTIVIGSVFNGATPTPTRRTLGPGSQNFGKFAFHKMLYYLAAKQRFSMRVQKLSEKKLDARSGAERKKTSVSAKITENKTRFRKWETLTTERQRRSACQQPPADCVQWLVHNCEPILFQCKIAQTTTLPQN